MTIELAALEILISCPGQCLAQLNSFLCNATKVDARLTATPRARGYYAALTDAKAQSNLSYEAR